MKIIGGCYCKKVRYAQGEPVKRQSCPDCGTSLVSLPPGLPDLVIVKVGTLDDPAQYVAPDMAFYCIEKQTFHYLPEELLKFDRFPE